MRLGLTHDAAFDFQRARLAYDEGFAFWRRAEEAALPLRCRLHPMPSGSQAVTR